MPPFGTFRQVDDGDFAALTLIDGQGRDVNEDCLVTCDSRRWYLKCLVSGKVASKELLAYLLSDGIANVAEVRRVTPAMQIMRRGEVPVHAPEGSAIIVRLVQDYSPEELPLRSLDEAVASELVYSLWIRRRDTHVGNKGYVDGVPMFFDHHIAFDECVDAESGCVFFDRDDDGGYAGTWTLREIPAEAKADLEELRLVSGREGRAIHFVHSRKAVDRHLDFFAERISELSDESVRELVGECGLAGEAAVRVERNLQITRASLWDDVELLRMQLGLRAGAG